MGKNIKPEDIIYLGSAAYPEFKNVTIWRYMSFCKFEKVLSESELYLCRLDLFEDDPYEGTLTEANKASIICRAPKINKDEHVSKLNKVRRWAYANCWYINDIISEKMFKDFGPVAIKTTSFNLQKAGSNGCGLIKMEKEPSLDDFKKINENQYIITHDALYYFDINAHNLEKLKFLEGKSLSSLEKDLNFIEKRSASKIDLELIISYTGHTRSNCKIGQVKYISEDTFIPENDPHSICFHKRNDFKHENELRLVYVDEQLDFKSPEENNPREGINLLIDINLLIEEIHVSSMGKNYFKKVEKLCKKHGLKKPILNCVI